MKISGANVIDQPVDKVWDALLDPRVLVATIPGCSRLESTGENTYAMTVSYRVVRSGAGPASARARSPTSRTASRW